MLEVVFITYLMFSDKPPIKSQGFIKPEDVVRLYQGQFGCAVTFKDTSQALVEETCSNLLKRIEGSK